MKKKAEGQALKRALDEKGRAKKLIAVKEAKLKTQRIKLDALKAKEAKEEPKVTKKVFRKVVRKGSE